MRVSVRCHKVKGKNGDVKVYYTLNTYELSTLQGIAIVEHMSSTNTRTNPLHSANR